MPNITLETATALAASWVSDLGCSMKDQFALMPEQTISVERGWVFFFNTAEFVKSRNPIAALAGNGPLLVMQDGSMHQLPSGTAWEDALKLFP